MKEIKKISLPIEKIDEPTPSNPAKKWIFSSIITILVLIIMGFLAYMSLSSIILNYVDVETEKKIFGQVLDQKVLIDLQWKILKLSKIIRLDKNSLLISMV